MEAAYDGDLTSGDTFRLVNSAATSHNASWRDGIQDHGDGGERLVIVVSIVVPIIFSIIVIVGFFGTPFITDPCTSITTHSTMITGNALVVTVVLCNPQMRSTTNLLIINLAIADLLFISKQIPGL